MFLPALLLCPPARAGMDIGGKKYITSEVVGFAFYQLAGVPPDFPEWVMKTQTYLDAPHAQKTAILAENVQRLEIGYANYSLEHDVIDFTSGVTIQFPDPEELAKTDIEREGVHVRLKLTDTVGGYFPFNVGEIWIAVIPDGVEKFFDMNLPVQDYEGLLRGLGVDSSVRTVEAVMRFHVKPLAADTSKPMDLDGFRVWLLLSQIAAVEVWSKGMTTLSWSYSEDGRTIRGQQELIDLKKEGP